MKALLKAAGSAGLVSVVLAALVPVLTLITLLPLTDPMPTWDHLSTVALFQAHDEGRPLRPLLLAPYNGHYNVLPRVLFFGMGLATRWSIRAEVVVGFALATFALGVLLRMAWRTEPRLLVLALPFAATVFSMLQYANFIGGFGTGQLLGTCASLLALHFLTDPDCGRAGFAVACLCGVVAFLSHGAAIGLAPAGLVALVFIRPQIRWLRVAAWGMVAAFGLGLGVLGGQKTGLAVLWGKVPVLTAAVFGRLFAVRFDTAPALVARMGAWALGLFLAVLAWRVLREWSVRREVLVRWGSVALMPLVSAFLISVARSYAPLDVVMRSHYVSSTYPFALALLVLVTEPLVRAAAGRTGMRRAWLGIGVLACVAAPVALHARLARDVVPNLRIGHTIVERTARRLALRTATDEDIAQAFHPVIDAFRSGVEFLRSSDRAWFAHAPEARAPMGALDRVSGRPAVATVHLREGSPWVFEGWALPPLTKPAVPIEVALFVDDRPVARAVPDRPRPDQVAYFNTPDVLRSGFAVGAPDGFSRPPGRYRVRVVATAEGRAVELGTLRLVVLARGKAAPRS
jgi:hypothetical protein